MTNEIVARVINDLHRIGLPGSAERLQSYIAELEKKASAVQPLDREQWRYNFAGQILAAQISVGVGINSHDYGVAVERAGMLLQTLERLK